MPQTRPLRPGQGGPRLLMSRLRQIMADGGDSTDLLSRIVQLIAATMVADVCSLYLRSQDDFFELVATEGLLTEAVGSTRMAFNEGLVGQVALTARALSVQDAPRHPNFSYRPETGEDPYHAFLGVPLLKGGRVVGVLVVQNKTDRVYDEEEIETLQTISMVLTEMVASALPEGENSVARIDVRQSRYQELKGRTLSGGIAIGHARLHDPIVPAARFFAPDADAELERLEKALQDLRASVDALLTPDASPLWGESRDILETYRLMAHDPSWTDRLRESVGSGLSAEAAVDRARREHRARLQNAKDAYLRDRLHDLEDLDNRLLRVLAGEATGAKGEDQTTGDILVARRLGPAELLEYKDSGLKAILLEEGGSGSHAMIVARALGLPAIGGMSALMSAIDSDDAVIVDGENGNVHIRPDPELVSTYEERIAVRGQRQAEYLKIRDEPAVTLDGQRIDLMINAGLTLDLDLLDAAGADGIGLFRTEFQFLVSEKLPMLSDQIALYKQVLDAAGDRPVLFRTLDLGGDKVIPTLAVEREENPALGWRSVRLALDRKGLFRRQIRALIRAADGRPLSMMFPLVASAQDFHDAKAFVDRELSWTEANGHPLPERLHIGAMVEAPSMAYAIGQLGDEIDFLSIGTNDLMQFFFAADRDNPKLADRYDPLSRPAMSFLSFIQNAAETNKTPISVCGEIAGRPLSAMALICMGFTRLSMSAGDIGPVKEMVRSVNLNDLKPQFRDAMAEASEPLRKVLLRLAQHNSIVL